MHIVIWLQPTCIAAHQNTSRQCLSRLVSPDNLKSQESWINEKNLYCPLSNICVRARYYGRDREEPGLRCDCFLSGAFDCRFACNRQSRRFCADSERFFVG